MAKLLVKACTQSCVLVWISFLGIYNLLFCPLLDVSVENVKSLCQVSANDTYCVCTQLPTQLFSVGSAPDLPTMQES